MSGTPPLPSRNTTDNAVTSEDAIQTARWTRYLPEAFGIRRAVEASKYRWCAREAALWGIATGTTMSLHRLRMRSTVVNAVNAGFGTVLLVMTGSYYFCVKRRDYHEHIIELMMRLNSFETAENMPKERLIDETHPFVDPGGEDIPSQKQYVAHLPERKEWQQQLPRQDAKDIFQPAEDPKR